jgi:hypothetical protein
MPLKINPNPDEKARHTRALGKAGFKKSRSRHTENHK